MGGVHFPGSWGRQSYLMCSGWWHLSRRVVCHVQVEFFKASAPSTPSPSLCCCLCLYSPWWKFCHPGSCVRTVWSGSSGWPGTNLSYEQEGSLSCCRPSRLGVVCCCFITCPVLTDTQRHTYFNLYSLWLSPEWTGVAVVIEVCGLLLACRCVVGGICLLLSGSEFRDVKCPVAGGAGEFHRKKPPKCQQQLVEKHRAD